MFPTDESMISIYLSILYSYICVHNDDFIYVLSFRDLYSWMRETPIYSRVTMIKCTYVIRLVFCFGQVLNHRVCH